MLSTILKQIILPKAQLSLTENQSGQSKLIIKETDPASKIRKLTILDVESNSFAFTLDYPAKPDDKKKPCFKQLSPYIHPENDIGINKGCDLVLFTIYKKQHYILIMDIKSDRPNVARTQHQLENSELYVKYLISLVKHFYSEKPPRFNYIKTYTTTRPNQKSTYKNKNSRLQKDIISTFVGTINHRKEAKVNLGKLLGK